MNTLKEVFEHSEKMRNMFRFDEVTNLHPTRNKYEIWKARDDNSRAEMPVFYLEFQNRQDLEDGMAELNVEVCCVWVDKKTENIVEEPEWHKANKKKKETVQ